MRALKDTPAVTRKQHDIWAWMRTYQAANSMPPTVREIARAFCFTSTNSVNDHLRLMAKKGLVLHRPLIARGWLALPAPQVSQEGAAA